MRVEDFILTYSPCYTSIEWWKTTSYTTMKEIWEEPTIRPEWRIWVATRFGILDDKTLRLFACWCARQVLHIAGDDRCNKAVDVAERFAVGEATQADLNDARNNAYVAMHKCAERMRYCARSASMSCANNSVCLGISASNSAWSSASSVDRDNDRGYLWDDARFKQAEWLKKNATPTFCL